MTLASLETSTQASRRTIKSKRPGIVRTVWLKREFALAVFLLVFLMEATILAFRPVRYTSAATILYLPEEFNVRDIEDILRPPPSTKHVQEEIRAAATSKDFLIPLIKKHSFDRRAAFNPALHPDVTLLGKWLDARKKRLREKNGPALSPEEYLMQDIAEKISRDLTIVQTPEKTYEIRFTSVTPDVSSKVANAIAGKLIEENNPPGRKKILTPASVPETFSEPDIASRLAPTGLLGIIIGISFAYLLGYIQNRKTGNDACTAI